MKQFRLAVVLEFDGDMDGGKLADPERVVKWQRGALRSLEAVERKKLLYGPEPWRAWNPRANGGDYACCDGYECGCRGVTLAEQSTEKRKAFRGRVVGFVVQERDVTRWKQISPPPVGVTEERER